MSRKRPAVELTDAQALRRLFPKAVRDEVKREVEASDRKAKKKKGAAHEDQS